jgi:hypothetical protein
MPIEDLNPVHRRAGAMIEASTKEPSAARSGWGGTDEGLHLGSIVEGLHVWGTCRVAPTGLSRPPR